ncbi:MAG: ComEC/Rec2 family competence protein [Chitinophagaceae bacterium]|nr:ComEC/Rec2 family competence protein [Oligoflexus sp.]
MRFFFMSQLLMYLILASPSAYPFRGCLVLFWLWFSIQHLPFAIFGALWQAYSLGARLAWHPFILDSHLRCDPHFWFVCTSDKANIFVEFLQRTTFGQMADSVRSKTFERCQSWHPVWGNLAYSLIMGGKPDDLLKSLYKNLGFMHVLVVSGSQFSLLAIWLKFICRLPATLLYAAGIIDWRKFRPLLFMAEFMSVLGLLIYLLACGASPPCQRAFLQQSSIFIRTWFLAPRPSRAIQSQTPQIFGLQALLFAESWFSLSNFLSWGAVLSLRLFQKSRQLIAQLKTSLSIQLLSLAVFSRISLSALLFDFFVSPLWDLLLAVCLVSILIPEVHVRYLIAAGLDFFHGRLWALDAWQIEVFGSSALLLRPAVAWWGRITAGLIFAGLVLPTRAVHRFEKR